jgi:hypothetical protein
MRAHDGRLDPAGVAAPVVARTGDVVTAATAVAFGAAVRESSGLAAAARTMSDVRSGGSGSREAPSEASSIPLTVVAATGTPSPSEDGETAVT